MSTTPKHPGNTPEQREAMDRIGRAQNMPQIIPVSVARTLRKHNAIRENGRGFLGTPRYEMTEWAYAQWQEYKNNKPEDEDGIEPVEGGGK